MAKKRTKTRYVSLTSDSGVFSVFFKKLAGDKKGYDFTDLSVLRRLLSNEKAKILNIIKKENPESIYDLAKRLGRDFKSVSQDIKLLESLGFIDLIAERKGKREKHRPVLAIDELVISFSI